MRANPTEAERKLWYVLRDRRLGELKWRRQFIIDDRYIVDFVCLDHRLIVEADGSQHADSRDDVRRDAYLKAQGFDVLRYWNTDILTNSDGIATAIVAAVESFGATDVAPSPHPALSRKGRGDIEGASHV
jgi:very-short-patch-repair endonuclease